MLGGPAALLSALWLRVDFLVTCCRAVGKMKGGAEEVGRLRGPPGPGGVRDCPEQSRVVGDSWVHAPTALQSPLGAAYKALNCAGNPELVISGQEGVGCEQF